MNLSRNILEFKLVSLVLLWVHFSDQRYEKRNLSFKLNLAWKSIKKIRLKDVILNKEYDIYIKVDRYSKIKVWWIAKLKKQNSSQGEGDIQNFSNDIISSKSRLADC